MHIYVTCGHLPEVLLRKDTKETETTVKKNTPSLPRNVIYIYSFILKRNKRKRFFTRKKNWSKRSQINYPQRLEQDGDGRNNCSETTPLGAGMYFGKGGMDEIIIQSTNRVTNETESETNERRMGSHIAGGEHRT